MLAGVAATGEDEDFSIISAGIFSFLLEKSNKNAAIYHPLVQKKELDIVN